MALANQNDFNRFNNSVVTSLGVGSVDSKSIKLTYQKCFIVLKVINQNKIKLIGSGTEKFELKCERQKNGNWTFHVVTKPGTEVDDAIEMLEHYEAKINTPPPSRASMPYGFSLYRQSRGVSQKSRDNFHAAVVSRTFHKPFVTFCINNNIGCRFRR